MFYQRLKSRSKEKWKMDVDESLPSAYQNQENSKLSINIPSLTHTGPEFNLKKSKFT